MGNSFLLKRSDWKIRGPASKNVYGIGVGQGPGKIYTVIIPSIFRIKFRIRPLY